MQVCVTEPHPSPALDLRSAGELAPSLALPWIVKLRYGLLAGQVGLILLANFAFGVELPIVWLAIPLAVTAASNLLLHSLMTAFSARPLLGWLLALDTLTLTALLALTGGAANPFSLLYLIQITLSAVVLSKRWTWSLGILSVMCFAFLFPVHFSVSVFEAHHTMEGFSTHLVGMWIAFVAAALVVTIFIGKVSEALRSREQEVLSLQGRIAHQERLASIVTLAAGAAHELGTPLSTIAIASRELEWRASQSPSDSEVAGDARLIRSEVGRCTRILEQMSARGAEPIGETPAVLEFRELLEAVRRGLPPRMQEFLRTAVSGNRVCARLPAEASRQALTALVNNAFEASENDSTVFLEAEGGSQAVRFRVVDTGCGMPPETLNRIAEPFFSTKDGARNMGLGTFLARLYAERLGGSLVFESEPGKGTRVLLELPLASNE